MQRIAAPRRRERVMVMGGLSGWRLRGESASPGAAASANGGLASGGRASGGGLAEVLAIGGELALGGAQPPGGARAGRAAQVLLLRLAGLRLRQRDDAGLVGLDRLHPVDVPVAGVVRAAPRGDHLDGGARLEVGDVLV